MSGYYAPNGRFLATESGKPLVGAKLYTYQAGTTTLQTTYQDSSLATPNTNPVITDSQGRALVLLDTSKSYDFVLKRSDDSVVWTASNVLPVATLAELSAQATTINASIAAEAATRATNDGTLQSQITAATVGGYGFVPYGSGATGAVSVAMWTGQASTGDLSINTTNGTITIPSAGLWQFTGQYILNGIASASSYCDIKVYKNAAFLSNPLVRLYNTATTLNNTFSYVDKFAANDTVQFFGAPGVAGASISVGSLAWVKLRT